MNHMVSVMKYDKTSTEQCKKPFEGQRTLGLLRDMEKRNGLYSKNPSICKRYYQVGNMVVS